MTDTSSKCTQLCSPHSACWQLDSEVSFPWQWTSSSSISPVPAP